MCGCGRGLEIVPKTVAGVSDVVAHGCDRGSDVVAHGCGARFSVWGLGGGAHHCDKMNLVGLGHIVVGNTSSESCLSIWCCVCEPYGASAAFTLYDSL